MEFKKYKKTALTKARLVTENELEFYGGTINTKEGPVSIKVGDYIAIGVDNEMWPIKAETMTRTKRYVGPSAEVEGFDLYESVNTVFAEKQDQEFTTNLISGDVLNGKAGDYFVTEGERSWIVDGSIFERTYTEIVAK